MTTIAFCGLGMMGAAMAGRLRSAGHHLRVWNRSTEKGQAWVAGGGDLCDSPQQAAENATQAHLMLADDTAVESTLFGDRGLLAGLRSGALVVDHSTVSVAGARERSARIVNKGWRFLQAPVFGSPLNIVKGEGLMLIGGAERTYHDAQATLAQILEQHYNVGLKPEDAATFKLMGNSMLIAIVEGLAEYYAIAKANGIDLQRAYQLFERFNPCGTIARRGPKMAAGEYDAIFTLAMARKDVQLMLSAAGDGACLPALTAVEEKMRRLIAAGHAGLDLAALGLETIPPSRGGDAG
jgi:3-hydroxyisobutyrate dehydrogenase